MKMTIECTTVDFARMLCEYINVLAVKNGVADKVICYQINSNTLSFFAMSGVKGFSVGNAVRALAGAEEVYNYAS